MITKPEIRKDYIEEKYVIIAPKRAKRPDELHKPEVHDHSFCDVQGDIFSPTALKKEKAVLTVDGENTWLIKVLKNKYPIVDKKFPKAYGYHEVVVETPESCIELEDLPVEHIEKLLDVYAQRTTSLTRDKKIEYVLIFKNQGGAAGASLQHAHSQIFATEVLPPHHFDKAKKQEEYRLRTGHCIYCDVITKELRGPRKVYQDKHVIAFCPYASMYNYEVWIMPRRHLDNITSLTCDERMSWAKTMKMLLKKIHGLNLPYNYYFHQLVNNQDEHFYMKIVPRGSAWAGVEIGAGLIVNPIAPEAAALYYRKK